MLRIHSAASAKSNYAIYRTIVIYEFYAFINYVVRDIRLRITKLNIIDSGVC